MYGYGIPFTLTYMIYIVNRLDGADYDLSSCYLFSEKLNQNFTAYENDVNKLTIETTFLCFSVGDQLLELLFFYLPAAISLPMNIVFFVLILKRIKYVQHEAKRLEEGTLQGTDSKIQKFLNKKKRKWVQLQMKFSWALGKNW